MSETGGPFRTEVPTKVSSGTNHRSPWSNQSRILYQELLQISDVVIRLSDTPWPSKNVPECLSANPTNPDLCAINLATQSRLDTKMLAIEKSIAPSGVTFADLTNAICPTDTVTVH